VARKGFWDFLNPTRTSGAVVPTQDLAATTVVQPAEGDGLSYSWHSPHVEYMGAQEWVDEVERAVSGIRSMTPAGLWREQPQLRTVVSFLGRNVAQLGLHTFERVSETDRKRDRSNAFARALADPGDGMTSFQLIFALTVDKALYDRAYWLPWTDDQGKPRIRRLPPAWVSPAERNAFAVTKWRVSLPGGGVAILPAERVLEFGGYHPTSTTGCSPTIESLKETLAEQAESTLYRQQVWKRGGRASAVIKRPADAPPWDPQAAERFKQDWYANWTGDGPQAGGTPLLEDGMTIERIDFSADQQQWAEGNKLSFTTVASAYHVNPTMVGLLDNANYSNVREFRRMLYGDTLGPYLADFEGVINTFGLPMFEIDIERFYAEFNIGEKLQGSFEEQAAVLSSATGRPWMTADEARAKQNMPALGGEAAQLVTPLNVLIGGQASPRDSGSQNVTGTGAPEENGRTGVGAKTARTEGPHHGLRPAGYARKTRADQTVEAKVSEVVRAFFKRQESVVRSKLGSKAAGDWWDQDRWDRELGGDLYALSVLVAGQVAASTLKSIGFEPDVYDEDRTLAWLKEVSDRSASSLNEGTRTRLEAALEAEDPDAEIDSVFEAQDSRADMIAATTVTMLSGFAAVEATKHAVGEDRATKTWITGRNARPDHAALDGETVLLSEQFSNGAAWPGDGGALGAEDLANCNCELQIDVP
jgi:HK97 family phage portal protein